MIAVRKQPKHDGAIAGIVDALKPWRNHNRDDTSLGQSGTLAAAIDWRITWRMVFADNADGREQPRCEEERPWREEEMSRAVGSVVSELKISVLIWHSRDAIIRIREDARDTLKMVAKLTQRIRGRETTKPVSSQAAEKIDWPVLANELDLLGVACKKVIENTLSSGRKDQVKKNCAYYAHYLIREYSSEKPTNGSDDAPFRVVAGLLYSMVGPQTTNTERPDLRRACGDELREATVRRARGHELRK
jgi:hypothetical protein